MCYGVVWWLGTTVVVSISTSICRVAALKMELIGCIYYIVHRSIPV